MNRKHRKRTPRKSIRVILGINYQALGLPGRRVVSRVNRAVKTTFNSVKAVPLEFDIVDNLGYALAVCSTKWRGRGEFILRKAFATNDALSDTLCMVVHENGGYDPGDDPDIWQEIQCQDPPEVSWAMFCQIVRAVINVVSAITHEKFDRSVRAGAPEKYAAMSTAMMIGGDAIWTRGTNMLRSRNYEALNPKGIVEKA